MRGIMIRLLTAAAFALMLAGPFGAAAAQSRTAVFAGGCFWCVEADFDKLPGVQRTVSGYAGGSVANPTYEQVSAGGTGHYEAVQVTYDPGRVSYEQLLTVFWHSVDPTDAGGQFCDRGDSYKTAVFAADAGQRQAAEASKQAAEQQLGKNIVTPILNASAFYPAEDYHQDYYRKNPVRYRYYRYNCGRDARVEQVWGAHAFQGLPGHS
jgi:peptide-methionine (S)-S-oxide reductase